MEESPPNLPHDSPQPKQQDAHECGLATPPYHGIADLDSRDIQALSSLYTPSAFAKIWFTAQKGLARPSPPTLYPEYTKPGGTEYVYRELDFWTSGFFPGCLYLLLERQRKHGHVLGSAASTSQEKVPHHLQLSFACTWWTENLHQNATLATTHDLGFMILPWAGPAWSLHGDARAFDTIRTAAETLASRFSPTLGCIRSWDTCVTKKYNFSDPDSDFLVIIDNMMNLNLLFTAASLTSSPRLRDVAVAHARRTQQTHSA
ncbi:hypothetical protein VTK73DRAFT_7891 [Phialemonium thermophilum]|uniref:Uncharacterized protein n=1 Tax=Phialemonium thermophilum TaxID=223376 RepID=A0ABR3XS68_9PEZI